MFMADQYIITLIQTLGLLVLLLLVLLLLLQSLFFQRTQGYSVTQGVPDSTWSHAVYLATSC